VQEWKDGSRIHAIGLDRRQEAVSFGMDPPDAMLDTKICPSKDVMYLGLSRSDVAEWYHGEGKTLIAADGAHPNKRCYALWAEFMATGLYATLLPGS
jgi:hypothetical protein